MLNALCASSDQTSDITSCDSQHITRSSAGRDETLLSVMFQANMKLDYGAVLSILNKPEVEAQTAAKHDDSPGVNVVAPQLQITSLKCSLILCTHCQQCSMLPDVSCNHRRQNFG